MPIMQVDTWDKLLNIAFLIFWFGIWSDNSREIQYNPFLAPISRWSQTAVHYVRGIFSGLSDRAICIFVLVFLLAFRALAFSSGATTWFVFFGFPRELGSPLPFFAPHGNYLLTAAFSVLSFLTLLFHIWSISIFFVHNRRQATFDNSRGALYWISRPFTDVRTELRPAVLVGLGMLLAVGLDLAGGPRHNMVISDAGLIATLARAFIVALAAWSSVFAILRNALIVLIIGSWVAMFTGAHALMMFCQNWTSALMGPLRRYPLRIGPLDLTPIVMIFLLEFIHGFLMGILLKSYTKLF